MNDNSASKISEIKKIKGDTEAKVTITADEVKILGEFQDNAEAQKYANFRAVIESLINKRVSELKILKTDARYEDVIKPVAARHNYLNSFFND